MSAVSSSTGSGSSSASSSSSSSEGAKSVGSARDPESNVKTVFLIRHGESTYNAWRKRSFVTCTCCCNAPDSVADAELSATGEDQVADLAVAALELDLWNRADLVVTSPLTRCLQTTLGGIGDAVVAGDVLVTPMHAERMDTICDVGRTRTDLEADFPGLDFRALGHGEDEWWYTDANHNPRSRPVPKEPDEVFQARVVSFYEFLLGRPETTIVVVGHSSFFKRLTGMSRKLSNCEIAEITIGGGQPPPWENSR